MAVEFQILYQDEDVVVVDKPESFHVHQPEFENISVPREKLVLQNLRDQLGQHLYPVHRLDAPTSGCLLFALNRKSAQNLCRQVEERQMKKLYRAVVRGWVPEQLEITLPLHAEDPSKMLEAHTVVFKVGQIELPASVGKRHTSARYSLVNLQPITGRFHQLRRHLNKVAFPIVGDVRHGDRYHNRFFSQNLGIAGLCLRAERLEFQHPRDGQRRLSVEVNASPKWQQIEDLFGAAAKCPSPVSIMKKAV